MEQRVLQPVEVERTDAESLAEAPVERRGRLDPLAAEVEFRVAVVVEDVRAHELAQPRRGQVIAHVGEAHARPNTGGPRRGGEQGGLRDAESRAPRQARAGPEGLRGGEVDVWRVHDAVPDR